MFTPQDLPTLHRMQAARDRINAMRHARAVAAYGRAFGYEATQLDMCIVHNALVSYEAGKPWRDIVDYSALRLCRRLVQDYTAGRLVDAWYRRKCGLKVAS